MGGTRMADSILGTQTAVYGWAFWFDEGVGPAIETEPYVNVCMYCGAGQEAQAAGRLSWRRWICVACGRRNAFWFASAPGWR